MSENFWDKFNNGKLDRRTFVKAASLMGGAAVFGLPLIGCQPATKTPAADIKMGSPSPMLQVIMAHGAGGQAAFAQEGVNNIITEFSGGGDQVRAVTTGAFPLSITSPTAGMSALEAGDPVRYIAGGYNASGQGFLVRVDSPFKKPQDLKGKKIKLGYSRPGSNSHIVAFLGLKALGIDPNDKDQVEFISTGATPDTWTAVKSGIIDVGWSSEPTMSDVELKGEGRVLWMTQDLGIGWVDIGIITTQNFVDSNTAQLKSWVNAYVKAVDWVKNHYTEAAKDLAQVMGVNIAVAEAAMKKVPKEVWSCSMPKKIMETMAQASIDFKVLKAMPDWKVLINQSFLPENLRDPSYTA